MAETEIEQLPPQTVADIEREAFAAYKRIVAALYRATDREMLDSLARHKRARRRPHPLNRSIMVRRDENGRDGRTHSKSGAATSAGRGPDCEPGDAPA